MALPCCIESLAFTRTTVNKLGLGSKLSLDCGAPTYELLMQKCCRNCHPFLLSTIDAAELLLDCRQYEQMTLSATNLHQQRLTRYAL